MLLGLNKFVYISFSFTFILFIKNNQRRSLLSGWRRETMLFLTLYFHMMFQICSAVVTFNIWDRLIYNILNCTSLHNFYRMHYLFLIMLVFLWEIKGINLESIIMAFSPLFPSCGCLYCAAFSNKRMNERTNKQTNKYANKQNDEKINN